MPIPPRNHTYDPQWRIYGMMIPKNDLTRETCGSEWNWLARLRGELWRRGLEDPMGLDCASRSANASARVVQYVTTEAIDLWAVLAVATEVDETFRRELWEYRGHEHQNPVAVMASRALDSMPTEALLAGFDRQTCGVWDRLLRIILKYSIEHWDCDSVSERFANWFSEVTLFYSSPVAHWDTEDTDGETQYIQLTRSESREVVRILLRIWKNIRLMAQSNEASLLCIWSKYV